MPRARPLSSARRRQVSPATSSATSRQRRTSRNAPLAFEQALQFGEHRLPDQHGAVTVHHQRQFQPALGFGWKTGSHKPARQCADRASFVQGLPGPATARGDRAAAAPAPVARLRATWARPARGKVSLRHRPRWPPGLPVGDGYSGVDPLRVLPVEGGAAALSLGVRERWSAGLFRDCAEFAFGPVGAARVETGSVPERLSAAPATARRPTLPAVGSKPAPCNTAMTRSRPSHAGATGGTGSQSRRPRDARPSLRGDPLTVPRLATSTGPRSSASLSSRGRTPLQGVDVVQDQENGIEELVGGEVFLSCRPARPETGRAGRRSGRRARRPGPRWASTMRCSLSRAGGRISSCRQRRRKAGGNSRSPLLVITMTGKGSALHLAVANFDFRTAVPGIDLESGSFDAA